MKPKRSLLSLVMGLVMIGIICSATNTYATTATDGGLYLGLEAYRNSGYSYKGIEKTMWKISSYNSSAGTVVNKDRAFYCLRGGPGFGSTTSMGSVTPQIRNYTEYFDLKNWNSIDPTYRAVLPSGSNYNSLVWVLENCYVPAPSSNATSEQTALATEYRKQLLTNAGIPNSKITDDEIDIVQQLAVWHFTNSDSYHVDTAELALALYPSTSYTDLSDINWDRAEDVNILLDYFITKGKANASTTPTTNTNTNPLSLNSSSATITESGSNYIVGPYKITEVNSKANYSITGTLKSSDGNTTLSYTLLDSNKNSTTKSLKELVGQEFYLSFPKVSNLPGTSFQITVTEYTTEITYWSVAGASAIDQPVAEVVRNKKDYILSHQVELVQPSADLALRKFIISVNGTELKNADGTYKREPIVDTSKLAAGTSTTATYTHTKNPVSVQTGDMVIYTIRVYNEGNVVGRATKVTDYLPEGLEFVSGSTINSKYGWTVDATGKIVTTEYPKDTDIPAFNSSTGNISYIDLQIECKVVAVEKTTSTYLRNIAEITTDNIDDRDSTPGNVDIDNYKPPTDNSSYQQDDDDYEDLILPGKEADLALRKFIISVNGTELKNADGTYKREPIVDTSKLASGASTTATYTHPKDPVSVKTGDKVVYIIRIYNEGNIDGRATKVTDYLPEGLKFVEDSSINRAYGWSVDATGKVISTEYLKDTDIKPFDATTGKINYMDLQIECEVIAVEKTTATYLRNIAEITTDNVDDRDSTPGNVDIDNYTPPTDNSSYQQDDDDYEDLVLPAKEFDLALRKFITAVNGKELLNEDGVTYQREPNIDLTPLIDGTGTTAIYKHRKDPVGVSIGDIVIYTIRVYNEGEFDGYASEITDYLPPELEFVMDDEEQFNAGYGWIVDSTLRKVSTNYLAMDDLDPEENLLKAFDGKTLDYREVKIKCRVVAVKNLDKVITNIAEITEFTDENGDVIKDRDSSKDNLVLPTDPNLPDYKGNDSNKSILSDKDYHYKGQEDDDDFDKLILEEFDLALRKFITGVNDEAVTDRYPVFTNVKDKNGNYIYEHTKEPVEVNSTDIVEYTIRIYNEGDIAGYAKEVKDNIPNGLEFLPNHETNIEYRWIMLDKDGNKTDDVSKAAYITTDYLSKQQENETGRDNLLEAFDPSTMTSPNYRDVKVVFKVIALDSYQGIITNIAEISDDEDENGNPVEDKDSTPDNNNPDEDDIDEEHLKLSYFDLALRKFITGVNDTDITNRYPVFTITEDGKYVYEHTKEPVEVENGNIVTYTLRIYNEGTKAGYAKEVKDDIPDGLIFLPEHDTNVEYRWVMLDEDGNETNDVSKAVDIKTDYLSKAQEDETGRSNLLGAFDPDTMDEPDYRDIKIAFKVTEPNTSDRIITNYAQISDDEDKDGKPVIDIDSTPDIWIDGEDDQDIDKIKVKYFDLALRKWVTQAIIIENGKETIVETGHKAEDDPEEVVKVEIKESQINKVVVKFRYKIRVTNEGQIAGYADEVKDYIPEGLKFVAADNPLWTQISEGIVVTDQLKDTLLQPGESAEVEILLTWINGKDNMGLKVNIAEISKDRNDSDTPDIDSIPDNKKPGEDDIDDAPVILTVKTGEFLNIVLIALVSGSLVIIAAGLIFIKKYVME